MGSLFSQPQIASIPGLTAALAGKLAAASNLSDLANAVTARSNLGLGNVNNTSDANKPLSSAAVAALDVKANLESPNFTGAVAVASGTLVASAPAINASQTWNNAAVTFIGLFLNVTNTASAADSKFLELLVGGASKFAFIRSGSLELCCAVAHGSAAVILGDGSSVPKFAAVQNGGGNVSVSSSGTYGFSSTSSAMASYDAAISRNAAGVVEFNNGTAGTLRDWKARNGLLKEYFEIDDLTYTPAAGTGCGA